MFASGWNCASNASRVPQTPMPPDERGLISSSKVFASLLLVAQRVGFPPLGSGSTFQLGASDRPRENDRAQRVSLPSPSDQSVSAVVSRLPTGSSGWRACEGHEDNVHLQHTLQVGPMSLGVRHGWRELQLDSVHGHLRSCVTQRSNSQLGLSQHSTPDTAPCPSRALPATEN